MSFENSGPIVEQPCSTDLSFIIPSGTTVTVGQIVQIIPGSNGQIQPTSGIADFLGVVKSVGIKSSLAGNNKATVTCGKAKIRYTSYGTTNAGDELVSGPGGTLQTLAAAASGDEGTAAGIATSVQNHSYRKAICDTGATNGNQGIAILL